MKQDNRPLSPHIQIYRPQLTSVLSISHRITGIVYVLGSLLLVFWLVAAAMGPEAYSVINSFLHSLFGLGMLLFWTFSLLFHLCNGIRHLFWDAGYGFELQSIHASGWSVVAASMVLTLISWILSFVMR